MPRPHLRPVIRSPHLLYYRAKLSAYALEKYNDLSVEKSLNSSGQLHFSFYLTLARKIALFNLVASAKTMVESLANLFPICLKLLNGIPYGERLGTDCVAMIVFLRAVSVLCLYGERGIRVFR